MSADSTVPTSTPLERDARLASTDHKVDSGEIALGVVIGRTAEFFDFFVYGIGSAVFMAVDRQYGRGVKLTSALLILGFSTAVISFLPGYARIGAASIILLGIFRIGQGFALGGAWDGLASLLSLNA